MGNFSLFSIKDYKDRDVYCSANTWDNHIVQGHEMMYGNLEAVKDSISSPDRVLLSDQDKNREILEKKSPFSTYKINTRVIVEYTDNSKGYVVTAFPSKRDLII